MPTRPYAKIVNTLVNFLASGTFFWLIVALFIFQAAWIALSFRYPMLYDEGMHLGLIEYFAEHWWPLAEEQPRKYDVLQDISRSGSYLFHYILSFPYRLITLNTDNRVLLVICLRFINIMMFSTGVWLYAKLFKEVGIRQIIINMALLFFVLLPITPFVAATINYDNLLFPLAALFLLVCIKTLYSKTPRLTHYLMIVIIGCVASLVKYAFLPIFAAGLLYVVADLVFQHRSKLSKELIRIVRRSHRRTTFLLIILASLLSGWFLYIYGINFVKYGSLNPPCARTMAVERCQASPFVQRDAILIESTHLREAVLFPNFVLLWADQMLTFIGWTGAGYTSAGVLNVSEDPLPIVHLTLFVLGIAGTFSVIYAWRSLPKNKAYSLLIVTTGAYALSILAINTSLYYRYHQLIATQPRYFLLVLPVIAVMMVLGFNFIFGNRRLLKVVVLIALLIPFSNGAGLITHIVRSDENWYWQNREAIRVNLGAKELLKPLINDDIPDKL